jgi:hypothetical protein
MLTGAVEQCCPCRTDLGLPDSSRRLDIDEDRGLQVDQVVVGVGKEGMPFASAGPLCGRIRLGDKLRYRLAAPQAASSRVSNSRTDRRVLAMASWLRLICSAHEVIAEFAWIAEIGDLPAI